MSGSSRAAKELTVMMTDVVRSTALRRARGDRDADDILGLQAGIVNDKVREFGGRVRKSLGDGFLISFPSTVAAVRAAAAIQSALARAQRSRSPTRRRDTHWHPHRPGHRARRRLARAGGACCGAGDGRGDRRADPDLRTSAQARRAAGGLFLSRLGAVLAAGVPGPLAAVRGVLERHLIGRAAKCYARAAHALRRAGRRAGQPAPAGR